MKTLWTLFLFAAAAGIAPAADSELQAAHRFRFELAQAVAAKTLAPAEALQQLQSGRPGRGRASGDDADFGQAADAVGRHLMGMRRPDAAEPFFFAAEESLERAVKGTSDRSAKAQYLVQLASIQASYLQRPTEAKANLDAAVRLQPDDKDLAQRRAALERRHREVFKNPGKK
jgi:hypothetical protein